MSSETNPCNECTVRKSTIFSTLNEKDLQVLGKLIEPLMFKKKDILLMEDSPISKVHLVKNGIIKIYKCLDDGRQQILRLCGIGDVLGLDAIVSKEYSFTAQAVTASTTCTIKKDDFLEFINNNQKLALKMLHKVSEELAYSQNQIFTLGTRTAQERIADFMLYMHHSQCSCDVNPRKITFDISRQEISELLGLKQETVIRTLSQFKKKKILEVKGREIHLLNLPELSRIAHSTLDLSSKNE